MNTQQETFPFREYIELTKALPQVRLQYHWKAEVGTKGLNITIWLGNAHGYPFLGCFTRSIAAHDCRKACPVQEMWHRVRKKIDQQDFVIVNGN